MMQVIKQTVWRQ